MTISKPFVIIFGSALLMAAAYVGFAVTHQQGFTQSQHSATTNSAGSHNELVVLDTDKAKLGYTIGAQIGGDLQRGDMVKEIDIEALFAGQRDVLTGIEPRMNVEQMQQAQQEFQVRRQQAYAALSTENKTKGDAFLASTKLEEGIQLTDSGLLYQVLREGKGSKPSAVSTVKVHYLGTLIDGTPFDSSYKRGVPADFPVNGVIPGFSEGLQLMQEGAKYRFVIPSEIAYGDQAPPAIGPNQVLIFEVELISVKQPDNIGDEKDG